MEETERRIVPADVNGKNKAVRISRLQGFVAGLLVMAVLAAAGICIHAWITREQRDEPLLGAVSYPDSVTMDSFESDVLRAPGMTAVYFDDFTIRDAMLSNLLESVALHWEGGFKTFGATYNTFRFLDGLGISSYDLPLFAVFSDGTLIGQRSVYIEQNPISQWLGTFKSARFYRAFPQNARDSVGSDYRYGFYVSELILLPDTAQPDGFLRLEGAKRMEIRGNETLYSLLGATFGGDGKTWFSLPDLDGQIPASGLRFHMNVKGQYPQSYDSNHLNSYVDGDIKYLEFPLRDQNQNTWIGEILLVKNVDEQTDLKYMVPCDGRLLQMMEWPALGTLLGNRFGGDGVKTFGVPDLSQITPPIQGTSYYIMTQGLYPIGG